MGELSWELTVRSLAQSASSAHPPVVMSLPLDGKVALVTGGAQGIGAGCCLCLAESGADVAVLDLPKCGEAAKSVVDEIQALGRRAIFIGLNALDRDEIDRAVASTVEQLGCIDIAVPVVGGNPVDFARGTF